MNTNSCKQCGGSRRLEHSDSRGITAKMVCPACGGTGSIPDLTGESIAQAAKVCAPDMAVETIATPRAVADAPATVDRVAQPSKPSYADGYVPPEGA